MRVVFLHGLESGPGGHKPQRLSAAHTLTVPHLPTREAIAFLSSTPYCLMPVAKTGKPSAW